ncbi:MAG: serine hydrolase domain-containing protein [Bacteroidota bacterium]
MKKKISGRSAFVLMLSLVAAETFGQEVINTNYSKAARLDSALQQVVKEGVPGCSMAVYSKEGWWASSAGFSKIEDKTPMKGNNLLYLQSVSKTYMAIGILKLYEQGKIDLEAPITKYLPEKYSRHIVDADKITIHMLMNHTSGIPEYNSIPGYITKLLQHPE